MTEPQVNLVLAQEHGLTEDEYQRVLTSLGRTPSWTELGIVSVMWSEHCSYKSSRKHLKGLPTSADWVLYGPGENAGVIDVGGGLAACFKMESHNHPSFIEPVQGAATGVGGILRDIFTMGARPIANLNSLHFGSLEMPRMRFLLEGVAKGIGGYGNCMGVPTVGGEIAFDSSYNGNILVNAFSLGVMKRDRIFLSGAAGVGNRVMYVGSKTGKDGIHGATMASEEFGAESDDAKRPRVQVGDPFTEKKLLEACLELMREDAIVAIQDMGAAGLTSSSCEMASKGALGIDIDVSCVPRRERGMTPYEVMLSESQERMLLVVKKGAEPTVERIFSKWDLDAEIIGEVTNTNRVVIRDGNTVAADLPVALLVDEAPCYARPHHPPPDLEARWVMPPLTERPWGLRLRELLSQPTIASKHWVYEQYDWGVRAGTVLGPGQGDAAVIRLPGPDLSPSASEQRGLAMTVDVNSRLVELDPYRGTLLSLLEAARNLVCVGAEPKAVTDCLNFGSPEKPHVMWSFVESIRALSDGCRRLETPIVSGNVSFYNETDGRPILPTPGIGMVGTVQNIERAVPSAFQGEGDRVVLLGTLETLSLAGSELYRLETGRLAGRPDEPDLDHALCVHKACLDLAQRGLLRSAHDVSEGGFAVALSECCAGGLGVKINLPALGGKALSALFGEGPSVIILSVGQDEVEQVLETATSCGAPAKLIGDVGGDHMVIEGYLREPVGQLIESWKCGLEKALDL